MKVSSYKKENDITYSLGATVTMEYLNVRPDLVEGVIIHPRFDSSDTMSKINDICSSRGIAVEVSEKPFNILSKKGNCFVIGIIRKQKEEIGQGCHVVLVNPSDAGNMGTIIRTCAGFGITDIAVVPPAVDMYDPKTVRASMGARARVRMELFESFEEYEKRFPGNHIYPFMLDGSTLLQNTKIESPFSLVFGNEASGLPQKFQKKGHPIRIEHTNNIDSLNLPTAAGIAVFEATRSVFGS
ncbi:MAG: TrmH family RNA methyltransferase [Clostridiales bacterium]|nr:TrmH family RNA methyltransferase [Clostridiales bacterium]